MKKFSLSRASMKAFFEKEELRMIAVLLSREAIALSLFSLAILLSLESLLPGTVSLREGMLFFVLGIAGAILIERRLSSTLQATSLQEVSVPASGKMRILFWGFILWAAFLFGNALFGFHPAIIFILLLITTPLLALFFNMAFGRE
ncbi:MAG: hypothetical protein IPJ67_02020 [Candidatus Moraniibacteriota bacterium]|nr:MAG: hypothetical protein IPJ67_02020 [Candidatus Moranbacteria bacterium]